MQNIEDLIQQVLRDETCWKNPIVSLGSGSSTTEKSLPSGPVPYVKIPISLVLLDNLSDLRTISPVSPNSPTLGATSSTASSGVNNSSSSSASSSNTNNTSSTSSATNNTTNNTSGGGGSVLVNSEYENKVATINDIVRKMVAKHIAPITPSLLDGSFTVCLDPSDKEMLILADETMSGNQSIFGPGVAPGSVDSASRQKQLDGSQPMSVNWMSLILKIHQALLQSTLHQNLLKKIASTKSQANLETSNPMNSLKDPTHKRLSTVSLSSNSLTNNSKPDRSINGQIKEEVKSTPVTPTQVSPLLKDTLAKEEPSSIDLNQGRGGSPITTSGFTVSKSAVNKNPKSNLSSGSSNVSTSSSSSSSSFSLSTLMANASSSPSSSIPSSLKDLANRNAKSDLARQEFNNSTNNPNINKLPSQFETDPVMLPDGSEYQNSIPIPNFQNRFPVGHTPNGPHSFNAPSNSVGGGVMSSSIPNVISPNNNNIPSMPVSLPMNMSSSYQGPNTLRVSSSPYDFAPSPSGLPPTRLTESFFPSVGSRGPPSFDAIPSQVVPQQLSVSPQPTGPSSLVNPLLSSGGFASRSMMQQQQPPTASPIGSLQDNNSMISPMMSNNQQSNLPQQSNPNLSTSSSVPTVPTMIPLSAPNTDTIVEASSSFKAVPSQQSQPTSQHSLATISGKMDQTLSEWLDISIYWTQDFAPLSQEDERTLTDGLNLDLRSLLLVERSGGRLDHFLESKLIHSINQRLTETIESKISPWVDQIYYNWVKLVNVKYHEEIASKLNTTTLQEYSNRIWSVAKYHKRRYPPAATTTVVVPTQGSALGASQSTCSNEEEAEALKIVKIIQEDAFYLVNIQHRSLKLVEKITIGLLGHASPAVRQEAVRLLNVIYDSHNWQFEAPLKPVIRCIGDAFKVELELESVLPDELVKRIYLLTTTPPSTKVSAMPGSNYTIFAKHRPKLEGTRLSFEAPVSLYRAGRFIVHPKLREEIMHEVWVDLVEAVWDPYRGEISKKGTLSNLIDSLDKFHKEGITTLYVMGLLEKLPNSHPFCPTDRNLPNRALGGNEQFNLLISKAKQLGIKIVIDSTARLSSKQAHRKYNGSILHTLDSKGQLTRMEGTDSVEFTWPDCVMMNFRKLSVWEMMVQETLAWGDRGIDGVRIDSGHICPLLIRSNLDELYRIDSDDQPHFTNQQIFDGEIVLQPSEEGRNFGYWGTTPKSPKQSTPFYPNPLFIKLTREVWHRYPQFVFLSEVYWERELHSIVSGLVPYSSAIPRALASVFDKAISKDGIVFDLRQRQSVKALYEYYEMRMSTYPQNSIILFPSSNHHSPYPLQIYNAGAWAAVDALYFLPEIPITYIGEQSGWYYHVDIHSSRIKLGMSATPYQLQYPQINGHYAHRVTLRKTHTLLRRGGMVPLLCYHAGGWHDRVFGFARFSGEELAIIAINFDNHETEFYVDCSPLARISTAETIYRMVDLINPSNPPQYLSLQELLYEKHFVVVPGYSSICWGVYHQVNSPAAVRVLYEHSMIRLKQLLADDVDPSHNLIYSILKKGLMSGVDAFASALEDILSNLSGNSEKTFASFIQGVLYHMTKSQFEGYQIISYLEAIAQRGLIQNRIPKICREVLQHNILGPIVFITPEIGRFSTVGGVGVMLDELTRSLQLLGVEVHIISPYYNYGKGGRTGYLEKEEGIKWQRNVVTYVGPDRVEVGVHEGVDKGIHLHFLHHFEYFPTPYNSGSPVHQLKTIVLFAKASLELLCQIRLLPSVIVTNDWFCGLVPAYAKAGAFGTTFNGTTFFHLVHNLEEAYQGRIYPDGGDDLNWIHQLHRDLIMEPYSHAPCLNASRCVLLTCNNWGTVSKSYLYDLLRTSHLSNLLHQFPQAFAHSNGIRVKERRTQLTTIAKDRHEAKAKLQKKYFNHVDDTIPIFSFVGRIVLQKGVHLILNAVRELIGHYQGKIQVLVGGMANMKDPYASSCAWSMQALCKQFPTSFWADPDSFFSDGSLVNLGSDFGLMPSLFEPSGVVQQEYFAAGTPVIAFKTGGLKDTVFEYNQIDETGNGFTFEAHKHTDFVQAIHRAYAIYQNPHHYQKIRERSYESVLDMSVVAEAWAKEFSRMRRSIWADKTLVDENCAKLLSEQLQSTKLN
ncbi:alpha amylase domain-containing protein [Heterostelium album PN500]|uniref:Alpha amylase domain-containing protein n=1 Tax=Heterostelium pallidum (strain ATCC 26659 / Pp 5 / PN500) TaxID=670386 RepID=D3BCH2_HETP5|nr:alpha amylase domain-containing protein [Heterostelium album PN500]EFA80962.1 alpha amylase domain-containing protein [Heterostelium album PN500]|eukprot:XP_020433080.1 alpha amylase domain-containing protein [Heterostelium album PN500]